jgi:short-subunit dehydrogenase
MLQRAVGHVVVVSSVVGMFGGRLRSGYSAAKHALHGFFEAARAELWRDGIRFTLVCPGYVRTSVSINAITADGGRHGRMDRTTDRGMSPERCAKAIWRAVEREREEVLIGWREALFVRFKQYAPRLFSAVLKRARVAG